MTTREAWRDDARRQRQTFEHEDATVAAAIFRDLGTLRTWRKKHAWLAAELWQERPDGRYLELGTGEGMGHDAPDTYPPHQVGVDVAARALSRARDRWRAHGGGGGNAWAAGLGEELPFRSASFDGVHGIDVIHHLAVPERAFAEMARVLRPGGELAFVEPNPWFPTNLLVALSPVERGIYSLTRRNLGRWLERAGLVDVAIGNVATYLPSFPAGLAGLYDGIEGLLGALPITKGLSTGRTIRARKP